MLIKHPSDVADSEITDHKTYATRRTVLRAGIVAATTVATGWVYRRFNSPGKQEEISTPRLASLTRGSPLSTDERLTSLQDITHYNNFYEFSTAKELVAELAKNFITRPWSVAVGGLCRKPRVFDLDELMRIAPEERVYRMRCVEGWSMVIPWAGFSLSKLLDRVEPLGSAKYVAFQTLYDLKRMPNQDSGELEWPYSEGLRMDEAMHPLTILATGMYGHELPPQDGAPVRLVVPWKYGFKGIKSIVKIDLVEEQPPTTWNIYAPQEYGFYANVNPQVSHPRWSQATELRIGELRRRPTLMFNGYGEHVAQLYTGMDLSRSY